MSYRAPNWLTDAATAVLKDLQGASPIAGLQVVVSPIPDLNGLTIGVQRFEEGTVLRQMTDDLDPHTPTEYGGGNWVPRTVTGSVLLAHLADILQEDLAESSSAWGESRPPCPYHPHPARAHLRDGEAWWVCESRDDRLYRIGRGEVPT
jgi:hypothetical protein